MPSRNQGKTWDWSPDAVEEDLNRLIEKRAQEADEANHRARQEAESARRYNLAARAEHRRQWVQFHTDMVLLHTNLADEHRRKAAQLADSEGGPKPGTRHDHAPKGEGLISPERSNP